MTEIKILNRWIVVIGAIVIQMTLGLIYTWSVMTVYVSPYIGEIKEIAAYIFGVGLLSFAITMIFAGQLQQKIGPMKTAMLGGVIGGIGIILSGLMGDSLVGWIEHYGIIFGMGIGFAYVCPIATAVKWFPDMKGLITGLAVAGFGAGSFVFNYLIKGLSNLGVPLMFVILGIIFIVLVCAGAITMQVPPPGYKPAGWTPPVPKAGVTSSIEIPRNEIVKTPTFWILWIMYVLGAMAGLVMLGSFTAFAKSDLHFVIYSITEVDPTLGDLIVFLGSIAALFNGLGRIIWGKIADKISYKRAMTIMFTIQAIALFIIYFTNINLVLYMIFCWIVVFCFGGNLSLFPTATADLFGAKNLGPNYGIVFTAYGIAGFVGATMVQTIYNALGSYMVLFIIMGIFAAVNIYLSFALKPGMQWKDLLAPFKKLHK